MRNDKLTSRFQNALADAQSLAVGRDNQMLSLLTMYCSSRLIPTCCPGKPI